MDNENVDNEVDVQESTAANVVDNQGTEDNTEATTGTSGAVETGEKSSPEADKTSLEGVIRAGGLKMIKDPDTGKIDIVDDVPEKEEEQAKESTEGKEPTTEDKEAAAKKAVTDINKAAKVAEYTPAELEQAIRTNTLDENRMPPSVREQWKVSQYQSAIQKATTPAKEATTVTPEQQAQIQEARVKFYSKIEAEASEQALKDIGLTKDDIEAAEYSDDEALHQKINAYNAAKEVNRARMINELTATMTAQQDQANRQAEIMNNAKAYFKTAVEKEPNWQEIDALMNERYRRMPLEEGEPIKVLYQHWAQNSLTASDVELAKKYYEDTRKEYYASKNGVKLNTPVRSKPPVVETPGTKAPKTRETFNVRAFRHATTKEKDAFFNKLFATMDSK